MKIMLRSLIFIFSFLSAQLSLQAQETYPNNGVQDKREGFYVFTNATVVKDYQTTIENATLIIRDGKIEAVGKNIPVPPGAAVIDLKGKYIYPSFIDLYSDYGIEKAKKTSSGSYRGQPQFISQKEGAYSWNEAVRPETRANELFGTDTSVNKKLRQLGFGTVLTHHQDGIARGSGVLVTLADKPENEVILKDKASAHYSFDKGSSKQGYPSSLMGAIALIRQTYSDAEWYEITGGAEEYNISLEAWNGLRDVPQIFEVPDKLSILRADKIGDEFRTQYIIKGNGDEYQRLKEIKTAGTPLIIPLSFPAPYDVEDPFDALNVTLEEMKYWEMAPANPALLKKEGIPFAITASGLKKPQEFHKNLQKAILYGLSEQEALKALTYTPANLLNVYDRVGSLEKGKAANFLITSGPVFDKEAIIFQNWVQGQQHILNETGFEKDIRGKYELKVKGLGDYNLDVSGKLNAPRLAIPVGEKEKIPVQHSFSGDLLTLKFAPEKDAKESVRLSGWFTDNNTVSGKGQLPDGSWTTWTATRTAPFEAKEDTNKAAEAPELGKVWYPFVAYGKDYLQTEPGHVIIKNATVWTNEEAGILENTDVLLKEGKIIKIGKGLSAPDARIIDGTGKHLTSGIVDEHSHIAIFKGVNEGTQAVTSEVRIGDVINSDDVNIYRQLAGGVTTAQLLHGSANPIGGQSGIIKFRWGASPEEMKFNEAPGFIKFALGENVKQSNWGDQNVHRFPQTRMGVEQVIYDGFIRAKEYEQKWKVYNSLSKKEKQKAIPPRRDLELEALVEILNEQRFITTHSYVQSEINMLLHAADSLGFKVNTFTHILEGYKVADKMAKHGAGGSTFADWWAYKYEVIDAIPYNAALMHNEGVVVALNSDDAEMGRRLNQEAAKIVKYGGVSEEDAWKMITLNPAKLLHIDNYVGSIKEGKHADVVLWSDNPLSIYAKVEKTFVDGQLLYDHEQDASMNKRNDQERNRLIQKMLAEKRKGVKTQKPQPKEEKLYHCMD